MYVFELKQHISINYATAMFHSCNIRLNNVVTVFNVYLLLWDVINTSVKYILVYQFNII
jgi:hypothetical protein